MIRTKIVELSTIEAAAYRRKLKGGKSGVVVMRYDTVQPGLATFSRNTGDPVPNANINLDLFPLDAFKEALELTYGMPYSKRGAVRLSGRPPAAEAETAAETEADDPDEIRRMLGQRKG